MIDCLAIVNHYTSSDDKLSDSRGSSLMLAPDNLKPLSATSPDDDVTSSELTTGNSSCHKVSRSYMHVARMLENGEG